MIRCQSRRPSLAEGPAVDSSSLSPGGARQRSEGTEPADPRLPHAQTFFPRLISAHCAPGQNQTFPSGGQRAQTCAGAHCEPPAIGLFPPIKRVAATAAPPGISPQRGGRVGYGNAAAFRTDPGPNFRQLQIDALSGEPISNLSGPARCRSVGARRGHHPRPAAGKRRFRRPLGSGALGLAAPWSAGARRAPQAPCIGAAEGCVRRPRSCCHRR